MIDPLEERLEAALDTSKQLAPIVNFGKGTIAGNIFLVNVRNYLNYNGLKEAYFYLDNSYIAAGTDLMLAPTPSEDSVSVSVSTVLKKIDEFLNKYEISSAQIELCPTYPKDSVKDGACYKIAHTTKDYSYFKEYLIENSVIKKEKPPVVHIDKFVAGIKADIKTELEKEYAEKLDEGYEEAWQMINEKQKEINELKDNFEAAFAAKQAASAKDTLDMCTQFVGNISDHDINQLVDGKTNIEILATNAIIAQLLGKRLMENAAGVNVKG
jgi:hypothetical protein